MADKLPGIKFLIFAAVCSIGAAWLIMVVGNFRLFPSTVDYTAELIDGTGLDVGDDVRVGGVRAGRVNDIDIERGVAVVEFNLDDDIVVRDTWETGLRWRNVIGQRYLYLYPVGDGEPLDEGDRLPAAQSRPHADVTEFFNRITPLLRSIDPDAQNTVITSMNQALAGKEERTQELIESLGSLAATAAEREPEIRTLIDQGNALLESYIEREQEIQAFFTDFADFSETVAARNDELIGAVQDIATVQNEFAGQLERNDADIRNLLDSLDTITRTIGSVRGEVDSALNSTRMGFATYMNISRRGQWFDVRPVAFQWQTSDGQVIQCTVEDGSRCSEPNPPGRAGGSGGSGGDADGAQSSSRHDGLEAVVGVAMDDDPRGRAVPAELLAGWYGGER